MQVDPILPNFEETCELLLEAPGVIHQAELRRYVWMREHLLETYDNWAPFSEFRDSLTERFEAGWLVEMGTIRMYRDHTGVIVIDEQLPAAANN